MTPEKNVDPFLKSRRTARSTGVLKLPGGNEDNDLWMEKREDDGGNPMVWSTWVLTDEQRKQVTEGSNITLLVWGETTFPLAMMVDDVKIGKPPPPPPNKKRAK